MEGIEIVESLGKHPHRVVDEGIGGEQIVFLASARVRELLEVLLDWPGLGVDQTEAGDVDVMMDVGFQINLVNVQTCH